MTAASLSYEYKTIDLTLKDYSIETKQVVSVRYTKFIYIFQLMSVLSGFLSQSIPKVDLLNIPIHLTLSIDCVNIQLAYYVSKWWVDLFGYLIFGIKY